MICLVFSLFLSYHLVALWVKEHWQIKKSKKRRMRGTEIDATWHKLSRQQCRLKQRNEKWKQLGKRLTVQKKRKQGASSETVLPCRLDSLQIRRDKRVGGIKNGEESWTRQDIQKPAVQSFFSQSKGFSVAFSEHTRRILCWQIDRWQREHTQLQDAPDSTWSTAVSFYCRHVIPAVCCKPRQLKPEGEKNEAAPAQQMKLAAFSAPPGQDTQGKALFNEIYRDSVTSFILLLAHPALF